MKNLKYLIIPCFIAVSTLTLNGCMRSSLEDRAGQWHVYTSMGEFTITVNETGDGINGLSFSVNCFLENGKRKSISLADPIEYQPPIPIKDNSFSIEFSLNGDKYKFTGEFSSDVKTLAGYYEAIWARYVQIAQKAGKSSGIYAKRTKDTKYSRVESNQIGHD